MKKGKGKIIVLIIVIVSIITVLGSVTACAMVSNNRIANGDELLADGDYNDAIELYEGALAINKLSKKAKTSLDMAEGYKKAIKLFNEGKYIEATEKLEELEDNKRFDIIEELVNETLINIEDEISRDGLGNTASNILNGGVVAYKGDYVYYANPNDDNKLYKRKINSNREEKISDDAVQYINIYKDYIYYVSRINKKDNQYEFDYEIKKVKSSGDKIETILSKEDNLSGKIQIVDNNLYYDANYEYMDGFNYSGSDEVYVMNLETEESSLLGRFNMFQWVLQKDVEGKVNFYYNHRYSVSMVKDVANGGSEVEGIMGGLWNASIVGVDKESIYYETIHLGDAIPGEKDVNGIIKTDLKSGNNTVVYSSSDFLTGKTLLLDNKIYTNNYENLNKLMYIDLNKGTLQELQTIDIVTEYSINDVYYYVNLFNIKDYIGYYNNEGKLIINKDFADENKDKSNEDKEDDSNKETGQDSENNKYDKKINEIKNIIEETATANVVFRGEEVISDFAGQGKERSFYSFESSSLYSPYLFYYDKESKEIFLLSQGIVWNITNGNVDLIVASDVDGFVNKVDMTTEQVKLYTDVAQTLVSNDTRFNGDEKIIKIADEKFKGALHYIICNGEEIEEQGIKLQLVKVNKGEPDYENEQYYIGDDGNIYDPYELIDSGELVIIN